MINVIKNRYKPNNQIPIEYGTIKANKNFTLSNYKLIKNYGFCYDKRKIMPEDELGNINTIPFGYNMESHQNRQVLSLL